jgi:hypothetical protein
MCNPMNNQTADDYLRQVIDLSGQMIELASAGDACRTDAGCGIVFGSLRDKAYKVRKLAQNELDQHHNNPPLPKDAKEP